MNISTFKSWISLLLLFTLACTVEEKDFIQPKPVAVEATEITAVSFRANWQVILTAQSYFLEVATDENFSNILAGYRDNELTGNSVLVKGLDVGQTYYYRVKAKINNFGSPYSNIVKLTTNVGTFGTVTAILPQQITLESFVAKWRSLANTTGYVIDVATDVDFSNILNNYRQVELQDTTLLVDRLLPNTTYFYRIRARRNSFLSTPSNIISTKTLLLDKPNLLLASEVSLSSFLAKWTKVKEADEYVLDVAQDANFQQLLPDFRGLILRDTSRVIRNLTPKANYFYRVRAKKGNFFSDFSNVMGVQIDGLELPTALPATLVQLNSFRANWRAVDNIDNYLLTIALDGNFTTPLAEYNRISVSGNFLSIRNLRPNTTYYYRINTSKSGFLSDFSNVIAVTTNGLESPIIASATDIDFNSFRAMWQRSQDADSYFLDVAEDFNFSKILADYNNVEVRDTFRIIRNLEVGKSYFYRIRAKKDSFISGNSSVSSVGTLSLTGVTALPATQIGINRFTANWAKSDNFDSYIVEISDIGDFSRLLSGFNRLKIIANMVEVTASINAGKTYYYRIKGVRGATITAYSNVIAVTTLNFDPPVALAASDITFTSFRANWQVVSGATSYVLDVATDANFANLLPDYIAKEIVGTREVINNLSPQTTYFYRVRAKGAGATSNYSNVISAITNSVAAPIASDATDILLSSFQANWKAVTGASSYLLEISTSINFTSKLAGYAPKEIVGTSEIITGLTASTTYYYRVAAKVAGAVSPLSNTVAVVTGALGAPTALNPTDITLTSFRANWSNVSSASSYLLTVALDPLFTSIVTGYNDLEIMSNSHNISGLTPNTTYYYRIKSKSGAATSTVSNVITITTFSIAAPLALAPTDILSSSAMSGSRFRANWQIVPGASYLLDVSTNPIFSSFVPGYNATPIMEGFNGAVVTGLNATTTYYYRVRATVAMNFSGYSNVIEILQAPVVNAPTPASASRFTANWNTVAIATSYLLDVSTSNIDEGDFIANILPNYNGLQVFANSLLINVSDIRPNHFYRVRSSKAGASGSFSSAIRSANIGVNGTGTCQLSSFRLLPNTSFIISFTYPSATSTLPSRITNTELDIRFDISYAGSRITQAVLSKNLTPNTLYQTWIFTYDGANNVSTIRLNNAVGTFVELWVFTYDAGNKITNWRRSADMMGMTTLENREYRYAPAQLSPNEIFNLTATPPFADEFDLVYDTWASPFLLLSKDLAMMVNYTTTTKPTVATPNPDFVRIFPFLPVRNIVSETYNPTATTTNYTYTRTTASKSVATSKRLGATTAAYSFGMTGICSL